MIWARLTDHERHHSGETVKVGTNSDQGAYAVISHADIMKRPGAAADSNYGKSEFSGKVSSSLSAGYYTSDPSDYCATGMTGVASGDAAYPYTVGTKAADAKPATVDSASVPAKAPATAKLSRRLPKKIKGAEMVDPKAAEAAAKDLAAKIEGKTVTIKAKGGASGRLHGKVTGKEVADALAVLAGAPIDKKKIELETKDIKDAGVFNGKVRLHVGVVASFKIQVEVEQA